MSATRLTASIIVLAAIAAGLGYALTREPAPAPETEAPAEASPAASSTPGDTAQQTMLEGVRGESGDYDATLNVRMQEAAEIYATEVEAVIEAVDAYAPEMRELSWDRVVDILGQLENWAGVIARSETHELTEAQRARVAHLRDRLSRQQRRLFPRLRAGLRDVESFYDGVHCHTTGDRDLVAICSAERFQRSNAVRSFQYRTRNLLRQMRFRQVVYQPHAVTPTNFYSDTFEPLSDGAVVMWTPAGEYREVG